MGPESKPAADGPSCRRLGPEAERHLWNDLRPAVGAPVARPVPGGWEVLLTLGPGTEPRGTVVVDLNCVTTPERWREALVCELPGTGGVRAAGFVLPPRWRGTYRFHRPPGAPDAIDDAPRPEWAAARRTGTTGDAPAADVWPHAPFSPAAELAVPDAPVPPGGPLRPADPEGVPGLAVPAPAPRTRVARIDGGRGTLVVLDGRQFLGFGLLDALRTLPVPPRTVLAVGSTSDRTRAADLSCDPAVRDAVLAVAVAEGADGGGPLVVAGASLGGAAATWWGLTRPDVVDGVVALSASFWMRDAAGRPVWEAVPAGGAPGRAVGEPAGPPLVLGWGSCEPRLARGCEEAARELAPRCPLVGPLGWVGGHDVVHWVGGVVEGFGGLAAESFTNKARLT